MVEPVREIKGIRLVYIRSMKVELFSYLRALEKEMMSIFNASPQQSAAGLGNPPISACKKNKTDPDTWTKNASGTSLPIRTIQSPAVSIASSASSLYTEAQTFSVGAGTSDEEE